MLNVNLTDYKERFGQTVPPGRYTVVVDDLEQTTSKAGNPMVNLWFRIVEGPHDGATIVDRVTVTEKALFRVVAFMQAIGQPTPRRNLQINLNTWLGKRLQVDVEDGEPYNGRVRSEVRGYLRIGVGDMTPDEYREFREETDAAAAAASAADLEDLPVEDAVPVNDDARGERSIEDAPTSEVKEFTTESVEDRVMSAASGAPQTLSLDDIDL